jgi:hypothetical protein
MEPPEDLQGPGLRFWLAYRAEREALGIANACDRPLLEMACRMINQVGGRNGLRYHETLRRLLAELGSTPVTRSKLPRPKPAAVERCRSTSISRALDLLVPGSGQPVVPEAEFSRRRLRQEQDP